MTGSGLALAQRIGGFGLLLLLCSLPGRLAAAETYTPPWPDLTLGEARSIVAGEQGQVGFDLFGGYAVGALNGFYTAMASVRNSERVYCFKRSSVFSDPKHLIDWSAREVQRATAAWPGGGGRLMGPILLGALEARFACAAGEVDLTYREEGLSAEEQRDKDYVIDRMRRVDVYAEPLAEGLDGQGSLPAAFAAGYVLGSYRMIEELSPKFAIDPEGDYCVHDGNRMKTWSALRKGYLAAYDMIARSESSFPDASGEDLIRPLFSKHFWVDGSQVSGLCR